MWFLEMMVDSLSKYVPFNSDTCLKTPVSWSVAITRLAGVYNTGGWALKSASPFSAGNSCSPGKVRKQDPALVKTPLHLVVPE